jgi:hypothetical protein
MPLMNTPRQYTRSVWCSHVQELRRSGLLAEVRAAASDRLVPLLDQPREAPKWMDGVAPAAILSRADSLLSVNSRGVRMKWMTATSTSGTVQVWCGEVIPPISWIAWEGIFVHVVELAGVSGAVGEARASADGLSCEIDVSWKPR